MKRVLIALLAIPVVILLLLPAVRRAETTTTPGTIPVGINAVYYFSEGKDKVDLDWAMSKTGLKQFTLAFIIASDNKCAPSWDGTRPLLGGSDQKLINSIRQNGGDVVVSFGGADGTKLEVVCKSPSALANAYQSVISAYDLKAIDIDIEGKPLFDATLRQQIVDALKIVKTNNPNLNIYITTSSTPDGLWDVGVDLVNKAAKAELDVTGWVVMPFLFRMDGLRAHTGTMADASIVGAEAMKDAVQKAYGYTSEIAYSRIGYSVKNGETGDPGEVFTLADFQTLLDYAKTHHIARYTFWNLARDPSLEFTKIIAQYQG